MQNEGRRPQSIKGCFDRIKVFRALGQNQHFASLFGSFAYFVGNGFGSGLVIDEMSEHVLNARIGWQIDSCEA